MDYEQKVEHVIPALVVSCTNSSKSLPIDVERFHIWLLALILLNLEVDVGRQNSHCDGYLFHLANYIEAFHERSIFGLNRAEVDRTRELKKKRRVKESYNERFSRSTLPGRKNLRFQKLTDMPDAMPTVGAQLSRRLKLSSPLRMPLVKFALISRCVGRTPSSSSFLILNLKSSRATALMPGTAGSLVVSRSSMNLLESC